MRKRSIYFDDVLEIEAYHLVGSIQKFPLHFHDYLKKSNEKSVLYRAFKDGIFFRLSETLINQHA